MSIKETLIGAIHGKKVVKITFTSKEKGLITRKCIPFDIGPSKRYKDKLDRYHFFDLDSPEGGHTLSILPEQAVTIELLDKSFEPGDYVKWSPIKWFIKRDWGIYS